MLRFFRGVAAGFALTLSVILFWGATSHAGEAGFTARVTHVIDGDTVVLEGGETVRYIGIDTPEARRRKGGRWIEEPQPFARQATQANRRLVEGHTVRLAFDRETRDRFGRTLAYVYREGLFVNGELVRAGLARARAFPPNLRHQKLLESAEQEARERGRGLWKNQPSPATQGP